MSNKEIKTSSRDFLDFLPVAVFKISKEGNIIIANREFREKIGLSTIFHKKKIENFFKEKNLIKDYLKDAKELGALKNKKVTLTSEEEVLFSLTLSDDKKSLWGIAKSVDFKKMDNKVFLERTKELEDSRAALINILEDVEEERKKAEDERDKTLSIISNFSDGLLVFNNEKELSLINPEGEKILETEAKEIVYKNTSELKELPLFKELMELVGPDIKNAFREELSFNEKLVLEVTTIPIIKGEEKEGILIILHNITREKRVEKAKNEFVSIAAHQLRTPLSGIKWILKGLLVEDLGPINKQQKEFLQKCYDSNERMVSLVGDLLNVTKIEEGKYIQEVVLDDISPVIEETIETLKEEAQRKKINITFKKPKEKLPNVLLDVKKIKIVITNLIDNAIKYSLPEGNILISIKNDKKNKKIIFSIKDSGIGIPEEEQDRLFVKFFRGSNAEKKNTEGSGLGIFVSKNIIEAHKGKMWFESGRDKGTTFYFSLTTENFLKEK